MWGGVLKFVQLLCDLYINRDNESGLVSLEPKPFILLQHKTTMASSKILFCMFLVLIIGNLQTEATNQIPSRIDLSSIATTFSRGN